MSDSYELNLIGFSVGTVREQYEALRKLIAFRSHHKASIAEEFQVGLDSLYNTSTDDSLPEIDRLLAIATLGRVASSIKKLRAEVSLLFFKILQKPIPSVLILAEPDDRSYVGFACEKANPEWAIDYCARAVVYEETGEQARVAFSSTLMTLTGNLESSLYAIGRVLKEWKPQTDDPGSSVALRIKRIMTSLCTSLSKNLVVSGEDPGNALSKVCKSGFLGVEEAKKQSALFAAAEGIASFVHEIVRLRFSLATESTTYSALKVIKSRILPPVWEDFARKSSKLSVVSQDIAEAILILAKQGVGDEALANELDITAGHKKHARSLMKKMADSPGLSPNIKNWLVEGRNIGPTEIVLGESQQLSDDSDFAELFVDSVLYRDLVVHNDKQVLPEIETLDPRIGEEFTTLLRNGSALCDAIQVIAKRKRLSIRGTCGGEEEYAPLDHEVVGVITGGRRVRIIRPVVEQMRESGVSFVISKGLVKNIE